MSAKAFELFSDTKRHIPRAETPLERRRNLRVALALSGELTLRGSGSYPVETVDVSLNGVRVNYLPRTVEAGQDCALTLFISKADLFEAVVFHGRLVRTDDGGCGVRFLAADQHDFELYVRRLRAAQELSERLDSERERGFVPLTEDWSFA